MLRIIIIFFFFLLAACGKNLTYSYLMQHPAEVKKGIERCHSTANKSPEQTAQCEMIMTAASDLVKIINEQQQNPEEFGQKILDAERDYVKAKNEVKAAKQNLNNLRAKKSSAEDLQSAQAKVNQAKQNCAEQKEKMNILLGVVGMSAPE